MNLGTFRAPSTSQKPSPSSRSEAGKMSRPYGCTARHRPAPALLSRPSFLALPPNTQPLPAQAGPGGNDSRTAVVSQASSAVADAGLALSNTAVNMRAAAPTGQAETIAELNPVTFHKQLTAYDGLTLVDFYTDYCGPCRLMHDHFEMLQTVFKGVQFAKYNCGLEGHEALATRQRIRSLPTFRLYNAGKFVEEVTGARPVQLRQMLVHYYRPGVPRSGQIQA